MGISVCFFPFPTLSVKGAMHKRLYSLIFHKKAAAIEKPWFICYTLLKVDAEKGGRKNENTDVADSCCTAAVRLR